MYNNGLGIFRDVHFWISKTYKIELEGKQLEDNSVTCKATVYWIVLKPSRLLARLFGASYQLDTGELSRLKSSQENDSCPSALSSILQAADGSAIYNKAGIMADWTYTQSKKLLWDSQYHMPSWDGGALTLSNVSSTTNFQLTKGDPFVLKSY